MLFQELVEQHRVDCVVTHGIGLPTCVANHEIRINLFHFLGHKAKLWSAFGIDLLFVAETDWFKAKDGFAGRVHRFDLLLEALRRGHRA